MSLTEALRVGTPQAFGELYDEYAEPLYAYCYVMVGVEAGDALREAFVAVAGHPDAVPGEDAELPVWLHSLARAACVRRGALVRAVATTASADPLRRALALLSPEHREVLALTNALDPEQTARVLGVTREAAEAFAWEAQRSLEQAAAFVSSRETRDSAMLSPLSGEALHRLVTLGHVPPAGLRERVLSSCATAGRVSGGAAVSAADGTPPPDVADDATRRIPRVSPDEAATAPLRRVDAGSADTRPDLFGTGESRPAGSAPEEPAGSEHRSADAAPVSVGSAGWEAIDAAWAEDSNARDGERPPRVGDTYAEQKRSSAGGRFLLPAVALVVCVAAATGAAFALSGSDHAHETGTVVRPSRSAQPVPSGDQTSPSPKVATSDTSASPTPPRTAAAPTTATPRRGIASPTGSSRATPKRPAKPTRSATATPTTKPTRPTEPSLTAEPTPSAEPASPTEPSSPTEPAQAAEPAPTAEATRSAEPRRPVGPRRPAEPRRPVGPRRPAEPRRPVEPTRSAEPTPTDEWPGRWTTRPRPHHTDVPDDAPADGQGSIGRRDPGRACYGTSERASRCARPHPWRPQW
ncbi:hypothetical protein [Actinoallomurus sp. NPDC050550]|uniref:RNA polymerase sigma factor n=1 Tax=Actinoallomurus sp. NPDC050550 TaxID=3154937 RepID=UPI0033EAFED3